MDSYELYTKSICKTSRHMTTPPGEKKDSSSSRNMRKQTQSHLLEQPYHNETVKKPSSNPSANERNQLSSNFRHHCPAFGIVQREYCRGKGNQRGPFFKLSHEVWRVFQVVRCNPFIVFGSESFPFDKVLFVFLIFLVPPT